MTVQFVGTPINGRIALVELPGARLAIRVRHAGNGRRWRCDACGRFDTPNCPHSAAVAEALIDTEEHQ